MSEKFVVGYDGSEAARRAVDFAVSRAKAQGGSVLVLHVLEWSPYSFLTADELAERHKRRKEELARAQEALIDPLLAALEPAGIVVSGDIRYGHIADTLLDVAQEAGATQIMIGRNGHSAWGSRVFGSVAGTLVQAAPVPCTIVP